MTLQGTAPHSMRSRTEDRWWSRTEYGHYARYDDEEHRAEEEDFNWRWQSKSEFYPVVFVREIPMEGR